jgi:hypothetical protein
MLRKESEPCTFTLPIWNVSTDLANLNNAGLISENANIQVELREW